MSPRPSYTHDPYGADVFGRVVTASPSAGPQVTAVGVRRLSNEDLAVAANAQSTVVPARGCDLSCSQSPSSGESTPFSELNISGVVAQQGQQQATINAMSRNSSSANLSIRVASVAPSVGASSSFLRPPVAPPLQQWAPLNNTVADNLAAAAFMQARSGSASTTHSGTTPPPLLSSGRSFSMNAPSSLSIDVAVAAALAAGSELLNVNTPTNAQRNQHLDRGMNLPVSVAPVFSGARANNPAGMMMSPPASSFTAKAAPVPIKFKFALVDLRFRRKCFLAPFRVSPGESVVVEVPSSPSSGAGGAEASSSSTTSSPNGVHTGVVVMVSDTPIPTQDAPFGEVPQYRILRHVREEDRAIIFTQRKREHHVMQAARNALKVAKVPFRFDIKEVDIQLDERLITVLLVLEDPRDVDSLRIAESVISSQLHTVAVAIAHIVPLPPKKSKGSQLAASAGSVPSALDHASA